MSIIQKRVIGHDVGSTNNRLTRRCVYIMHSSLTLFATLNCTDTYSPGTLDDEALDDDSAEQPAVCKVDPQLALDMYAVPFQMGSEPLLRRVFHSMVAMFQAAHNYDYYITKY